MWLDGFRKEITELTFPTGKGSFHLYYKYRCRVNPSKIPVDMRALMSELNDIKKIMDDIGETCERVVRDTMIKYHRYCYIVLDCFMFVRHGTPMIVSLPKGIGDALRLFSSSLNPRVGS
jgi:hypothetical protein